MTNGWTAGSYAVARAVFGTYLALHFAQLLPWASEVFSNEGVLPDGTASPLLFLFPNILALWDSPAIVTGMVAAAAALSVLIAAGRYDRTAAILVYYVWACLHGRMPLISNPGLPYVGWMLLAHAALPPMRESRARGAGSRDAWHVPDGIFLAAWVLMALGYTYSGWTKLVSPSWVDGTALARVLDNPLVRPSAVRDALLALPGVVLRIGTWTALAFELAFAPLALAQALRPWLWAAMVLMHLSLILLVDFADLSLGMLMLHLFTFDPGWLTRPAPRGTLDPAWSSRSTGTLSSSISR